MKKYFKNFWIRIGFGIIDLSLILILGLVAYFDNFIQMGNGLSKIYLGLILLGIALIKIAIFTFFKIYHILTKTFGIVESVIMLTLSFVSSILLYSLMYFFKNDFYHLSITFILFLATAEAFVLTSTRFFGRIYSVLFTNRIQLERKRTIVIGAGAGAKYILDESRTNRNFRNRIVCFVDDDPKKIGGRLSNRPILGPVSEIKTFIQKYRIEEAIIGIANLDRHRLYEIMGYIRLCNVKIKRLPLLSEMDKKKEKNIVDVDINEILSRSQVVLKSSSIQEFITGKTVLVTGAGGSIGSELVKQIFANKPQKIVLVDIYENSLYDLQQEIVREMRRKDVSDIEIVALVASTYNEKRMDIIFDEHKPHLVFHAAAYKHVPLMEDSPVEAIRSNIIGTYNIAKLSLKHDVEKMVLVSTDKAVRPTNVMGATKRFAEMIIQYYSSISNTTKYSAVRFGNVLGSNGSVIPLFKKQIEEGGPVTVTHPEVMRFFMTIPEAVSLILQSGEYAKGGEIFILDMGNPIRIVELAEKMIRQAGFIPYKEMGIIFTGLRPGEKMYEEVLLDISKHTKTVNDKIYIERREKIEPIEEKVKEIMETFDMVENKEIRKMLKKIVATYKEPQHV